MLNSKYLNTLILQYQPSNNVLDSIEIIDSLLKKNKVNKNTLVICPELSLQRYICITKEKKIFKESIPINSEIISNICNIAKKYNIFLCISFFEKDKNKFFNTAIVINPNGQIIKKYHKKNIPSETCYQEKYYFNEPKNNYTSFRIGSIRIGILICWDQWYSRSYEELKKQNVNLIICPTAIGFCTKSSKNINIKNEKIKWLEVIKANSLMNNIPLIICNRTGKETRRSLRISFWGYSFITDSSGTVVKKCGNSTSVIHHRMNIKDQNTIKKLWNF